MKKMEHFWGTPKQTVILISCITATFVLFGIGTIFAVTVLVKHQQSGAGYRAEDGGTGVVTLEEAIAAALADAGLESSQDVTITKAGRDLEHGFYVYDIEFYAGDTEYEYEIYEDTGVVYSKSKETIPGKNSGQPAGSGVGEDIGTQVGIGQPESQQVSNGQPENQKSAGSQPESQQAGVGWQENQQAAGSQLESQSTGSQPEAVQQSTGGQPVPADQQGAGQISPDAAKEIAVSDAGLSVSDVTWTKAELEYEDGIAVYEIEFHTHTHEYEYEIYASDGSICSKDKEALDKASGNAKDHPGSDIGIEQAKSIVLKHAGYSSADVHFSKAKFEEEHGVLIYEIEFYTDGMEYEYEIDAATGEILKFDAEYDD